MLYFNLKESIEIAGRVFIALGPFSLVLYVIQWILLHSFDDWIKVCGKYPMINRQGKKLKFRFVPFIRIGDIVMQCSMFECRDSNGIFLKPIFFWRILGLSSAFIPIDAIVTSRARGWSITGCGRKIRVAYE